MGSQLEAVVPLTMLLYFILQTIIQSCTCGLFPSPGPGIRSGWSKVSSSSIPPSLPRIPLHHPHIDRTVSVEKIVELDPEADWKTAVEKNLANQSLYNNAINEVFNGLTRIIGWTLIVLVLYGFSNVGRRREAENNLMENTIFVALAK